MTINRPTVQAASEPLASEVTLDASSFPLGSLRPLSEKVCAARLGDGRILAFSRRCPHEGADLALGRLQGNRIVCPWHNLVLDLETGQSRCLTVRRLRSYPVRVEREHITVSIREADRGDATTTPHG